MGRLQMLSDRITSREPQETAVDEKDVATFSDSSTLDVSAGADAQGGVKEAEAVTQVWSRKSLYAVYAAIFLVFFINSLQQQTSNNLVAYVTSDFYLHELVATTSIVSTIIAGVIKLPMSKVLDLWGRNQGYIFMTTCATIGLIMMAACNGVTLYAAAQVFYWVGVGGIIYVLDVIIADTSSLQNRALMFAFSNSPYIATAFAGPSAAQSFLGGAGWRWGYGTFAIVLPIISLPIMIIFYINRNKALKEGVIPREPSGRTATQSIVHYAIEFDRTSSFDPPAPESDLTVYSVWNPSHLRWSLSLPVAVQLGNLRRKQMAFRFDHCHARDWHCLAGLLRRLGALLRPQGLLALELPRRPNHPGCMSPDCDRLLFLLLLGLLSLVHAPGRLGSQRQKRWLRGEHLQHRLLLLQHCGRRFDPLDWSLQVDCHVRDANHLVGDWTHDSLPST
jgi:MFS family permease